MERGLDYWRLTMSDLEKRYILKRYNDLLRQQKEVKLCYRGTAYKKTVEV